MQDDFKIDMQNGVTTPPKVMLPSNPAQPGMCGLPGEADYLVQMEGGDTER